MLGRSEQLSVTMLLVISRQTLVAVARRDVPHILYFPTTFFSYDALFIFIRIQRNYGSPQSEVFINMVYNEACSHGLRQENVFPPRSASGCTLHILEVSVSNADNRYGAVIGADQCQVAAASAVYVCSVYSHPLPICSRIWYSSAGHNGNIQISWYTLPRQTHTLQIIITAAISPNNLGCEIFYSFQIKCSSQFECIPKSRKITQPI